MTRATWARLWSPPIMRVLWRARNTANAPTWQEPLQRDKFCDVEKWNSLAPCFRKRNRNVYIQNCHATASSGRIITIKTSCRCKKVVYFWLSQNVNGCMNLSETCKAWYLQDQILLLMLRPKALYKACSLTHCLTFSEFTRCWIPRTSPC